MKSVVFSGSLRYADQMSQWVQELQGRGVKAYAPQQKQPQDWNQLPDADRRKLQLRFINEHNQAIDDYDVLFVFNPEGRVGNSVTLEVGYALAKAKPVYAMTRDSELGRDVLYAGYCKSVEGLIQQLSV
ncbi:hypothetical protein EPO04_04095 [Patescibacteria group bacterium]|nr:MAG: hypothetical protein EPO04_04095 [Patescibacteria group bacterium]